LFCKTLFYVFHLNTNNNLTFVLPFQFLIHYNFITPH
ncbi:hypothetical protein ISN45_At02g025100, partial [Arabidopsis thaliana x Arabidopsis arenosa]